MIGKKLSVKKMFFWLTAGMALTMTVIILVAFFLTKHIVVLWVGTALIVCAILWMPFMVQLLGMRLLFIPMAGCIDIFGCSVGCSVDINCIYNGKFEKAISC